MSRGYYTFLIFFSEAGAAAFFSERKRERSERNFWQKKSPAPKGGGCSW
jgi:hypothetical protein